MKKRIILSSVITMLLCLCMIGGATYALFTSETSVNIAVTSGKVKVEAGIENLELYSMGVKQAGQFELGGTAVYDEKTGMLTLTNVAPGDKVVFDIVVENSSNIDIQYKANWTVEGKLNEVLVATANGKDFADVDWTLWAADSAEKKQTIKVVVELPVTVGNEYQEQVANIAFRVEAVQANGVNLILANGVEYATIEEAITAAGANGTIQFNGTVKLAGAEGTSQVKDLQGITFEGIDESATLVFVNVDGSNSTGTCSFANINMKNLTVVDETFYTGENGENAWEFTYLEFGGENKFENVEFTDGILIESGKSEFVGCSFEGHNNDSSSYGNTTMYGAWVYNGEATFTNCSFFGTRGLKVADQYADSDVQKVVVDGCEFGPLSEKPGIAVDNRLGALELTIKNSTFAGTQPGDAADGGNGVAYIYENDNRTPDTTTITCENNEIAIIATPKTIAKILAAAKEGDEIALAAGYYDEIVVPKNRITLFSNEEAVVGFLNVNGKDNVTIQGLTFDAEEAQLVYDGRGSAKQFACIAGASGKGNNKGANNLVIDGCTFAGAFVNGGVAIAFVDQGRGTGQSGNITIKNCEFATTNGYYDIYTHYSGKGSFVIEGNTFASENLQVTSDIYLGRYQSSTPVVLANNTFVNRATFEKAADIQDHSNYGVSFDASGNTFGN